MLGGVLRFVAYRDTHELLKSWAPERPILGQLARLSECLVAFPAIPVPLTSQPIHQQFDGHLDVNYLAVQFSTRRAPGLSSKDQLKVTCFRTWLLLKALQFAAAGHISDRSLHQLCTQLRMGLDDRDAGKKLAWFLAVVEPLQSLQQFELALTLNIAIEKSKASGTVLETIRSIHALLENRPRPEQRPALDWTKGLFQLATIEDESSKSPDWSQFSTDESDPIFLPQSDAEDEIQVRDITVSEDATPPQVVDQSRGIAFQSLEDQQYLPFSWNRLRSDELAALREDLQSLQLDSDPKLKLLAAIAAIAVCTRRSMKTIEAMPLSSVIDDDWQLDLIAGRLHRRPSRRHVRWKAGEKSFAWVRIIGESWQIEVHTSILEALRHASQENPKATTIGQLWGDPNLTLESAFNKRCQKVPALRRISSGLLVRQPEQIAFEQEHDPTFARLITSPARAGLPGATAYASWSQGQAGQTINQIINTVGTFISTDTNLNALGSELDPDDELLRSAFARAKSGLDEIILVSDNWIEYHNRLVAYGVLMLLAGTGARPVTSVFESSRQFDTRNRQIFIEDKASRSDKDGTAGRLVPMISGAAEFLTQVYWPYLQHLSEGLQPWLPALADEIALHLTGAGSDKLPLFFLLKRTPEFDWVELTESSMRSLGLIDWPLPLNLFRHRLATRLRTASLDPELIDAQLGHAESGSETFGDRSPRCWKLDQPTWLEALEKSYATLKISQPALARLTIKKVVLAPGYLPFPDEDFFGKAARSQQRSERKALAARDANAEIQAFIESRPIESIAPAEWERLGRSMLLTGNNLRQPNAAIRYQVFEEFLQREWRENGQRPRLRKWLAQLPKPQTAFRPHVIGVADRLNAIRAALDEIHTALKWPVSKSMAGILAALDLCAHGRVNARPVIDALANADNARIRLVLFEQRAYIEYSEFLLKTESAPVQRYVLPSRAARLAEHAMSAGKSLDKHEALPPMLQGVVSAAGISPTARNALATFTTWLIREIEQENAVQLPGIVAGVLAGRVKCFALPWHDWIRVQTGKSRTDPRKAISPTHDASEVHENEMVVPRAPIGIVKTADRERNKIANRDFLGQIRSALNNYLSSRTASLLTSSGETTRNKRTNTESTARRDARANIEKILSKADPVISVTIFALGSWALHLLYHPYKKGLLDAASIKRYMDSLSNGFLSFGLELDLADLDSDELTEFYRSVIESADQATVSDQHADDADSSERISQPRNQKFVLQRIEEFHRFASKRFGLETPDWSEVGDGVLSSLAKPGTVTEEEYLHTQQSLCPHPFSSTASSVREAFVLLLAYRFGLRGGEAIGLRRSDWVEVSNAVVLLVSSRYRQLKTRGSQRQIPLLEKLTTHEEMIVRRWLAHWSTETGNDEAIPLFFDDLHPKNVTDLQPIRSKIITALQAATGSDQTTLHHARHAYANRLVRYLACLEHDPMWPFHAAIDTETSQSARRATLLTECTSRRALWAVARLLGHASPATTVGSYLHVQFEWANQQVIGLSPVRFEKVHLRKCHSATNIDRWELDSSYLQRSPTQPKIEFARCTPSLILKYCRLRAQGIPPRSAGEQTLLAARDWQTIEDALALGGVKLASGVQSAGDVLSTITRPLALLGPIQKHRWQTLISYCEAREKEIGFVPEGNKNTEAGQQIGRTRQLLLWSADHFIQLRQFMIWMGFEDGHIDLYRPAKLDARLIEWAEINGFLQMKGVRSGSGKKAIQLDVANEMRKNTPPVVHPHRVAAVITASNPVLRDGYEMLIVWLVFTVCQVSTSSSGGSILVSDTSS